MHGRRANDLLGQGARDHLEASVSDDRHDATSDERTLHMHSTHARQASSSRELLTDFVRR